MINTISVFYFKLMTNLIYNMKISFQHSLDFNV